MALRSQGVFLGCMEISNPVGISLPAYADLFAGRRQEAFLDNRNGQVECASQYPTIFQAARRGLGGGRDSVALIASWKLLASLSTTPDGGESNDFFRSVYESRADHFKPEIYDGARSDMDTFLHFACEVPRRRPQFIFVHFGDADEEGHLHQIVRDSRQSYFGIFHYHQALRASDYYVGRIWELLQSDPFYRDSTYLIVSTDHGRDNTPDDTQWWDHGACVERGKPLCSGCKEVFGLVVGPGLAKRHVEKKYSHIDFAPTIAHLLNIPMPTAAGTVIEEAIPVFR